MARVSVIVPQLSYFVMWFTEYFSMTWRAVQKRVWKNLTALKFSILYKDCIFQSMCKIFCVYFHRYSLKFHTKYLTHVVCWEVKILELLNLLKCFWNVPWSIPSLPLPYWSTSRDHQQSWYQPCKRPSYLHNGNPYSKKDCLVLKWVPSSWLSCTWISTIVKSLI